MNKLTVGSVFSGIGGIDLGFEQAGLKIAWQCEINEYCRNKLANHWPSITLFKNVNYDFFPNVDVLVGGVPCQPVSQAAARSNRGSNWLWSAFFKHIKTMRPKYAILENPEALRFSNRGLGNVLSNLASIGYDAEWTVLRASDFGAPHKRARIWVVAYPNSSSESNRVFNDETPKLQEFGKSFWEQNAPRDLQMVDGLSSRMALRAYGNSVLPDMADYVGNCIIKHSKGRK